MFQKKLITIIFFIALECFSQNKATISKVLQTIEPNRIQANMTFLADDLLQGRQPGTKGFALASKYIESELLLSVFSREQTMLLISKKFPY